MRNSFTVFLVIFLFFVSTLSSWQILYQTYTICFPVTAFVIIEDEYGNRGQREETEYRCNEYIFAVYLLEPGDIYSGSGNTGSNPGGAGGAGSSAGGGSRDADLNGVVDCWSYLVANASGLYISSYFGEVRPSGKIHNGIDITGSVIDGLPVISATSGEIVEIGYNDFNGYYVKIKDNRGFYWTYCHLKEDEDNLLQLTVGQGVNCGLSIIGYVDNSGNSSGPHLHLSLSAEIRNSYLNPLDLLNNC